MPLLNMIGVEHLPSGVSVGTLTNCFGLEYLGLEAKADWTGNNTNYPNVAHLRPDGANIVFGGLPVNGNNGAGVVSIPLKNLMNGPVTPDRLFIGFRWIKLAALNGVTSMPIFSLLSTRYGAGNNGVPANAIITDANTAVGTTYYYVLDLNFTTGKYTVYRDGTALNASPLTIPSGCSKTTVQNWWWAIGRYDTFVLPSTNDYKLWAFRDIYVNADLGILGDTMNLRLNSAVVTRCPLASAVGTGYTANDAATLVAALNTKKTTNASLITPSVSVPTTADELVCKIDASALSGLTLRAFQVNASVYKETGVVGQISAKTRLGNSNTTQKTLSTAVTTGPIDQNVAVMSVRPDGSQMTPTSIADVELVFAHTAT